MNFSTAVQGVPVAVRARTARAQRGSVRVQASWTKATTQSDLKNAGGRTVVVINDKKVLVQEFAGDVYAVSNKCSHLGLPLQGKVLNGQLTNDGCIVCSAHGTAFDLKTGDVKGEWCPKMPDLPFVGKMGDKKPLPTYQVKIESNGDIMVNGV